MITHNAVVAPVGGRHEGRLRNFSPETLEEIRTRAAIDQVAGRIVQLKKKGDRLWGLCPFHPEKTPSFSVSPSKQLFHCFGCQAGGDVIDFLMRAEGLSFPEAIESLAKDFNVPLPEARPPSPKAQGEALHRRKLARVNEIAAAFFRDALAEAEEAQTYLRETRGLDAEVIERFQLGWAPASWDSLTKHLGHRNVPQDLAIEVGLVAENKAKGRRYDRLRGRVVFPIQQPRVGVVGFGARRADWVDPEGPKYLNSPESPIYQKSRVLYGIEQARDPMRKRRRAIVVEGYLDVIALAQRGFTETVAACGTALASGHVDGLKGLVPTVYLAYDGDAAGQAATEKAIPLLLSAGLDVRVLALPEGQDPDDWSRSRSEADIEEHLRAAPSGVDHQIRAARRAHRALGVSDASRAIAQLKPTLKALTDPLAKDLAIDAIARAFDLSPAVLKKHLGGRGRSGPLPTKGAPSAPRPDRARPLPALEVALVRLLVDHPDRAAPELARGEVQESFTHEGLRAFVQAAVDRIDSGQTWGPPQALDLARALEALHEGESAQLRESLINDLPRENDLSECVTRLLNHRKQRCLRLLLKRLETEEDPAVASDLAIQAQKLMAQDG